MNYSNQKGVSIVQILIFVIIFGILIGGGFLLLNNEKAKTRDAKRLSDITRIQAAFEFLINDRSNYLGAAENGCNQTGMLVSQCNLGTYLPSIAQFKDPGSHQYLVVKPPTENNYEISFELEKDYYGLKAGTHYLDQAGIR
ncbi:hypothetical protein KKF61_01595 [Patescibacteria group bacterium]|nr:hypothetical protein [Patescibacteria group bacterium]MBU0964479.1 hypothetical protein [Patescibacteria group bacterium]